MKALLLRSVGELELVDVDPPVPSEDDVLIEVSAAGVCGSDFHSARDGGLMRNPPIIMGHEFSGVTDGRAVTANPLVTCGSCPACRRGEDNICADRSIIGITRQGAFAEVVSVPSRAVVELPEGVSADTGALVEPLAVALHGVKLAAIEPSQRVAIIGAGAIGLLATHVITKTCDDVTVVDLDTSRHDLAAKLGATEVGDRLRGEFDVVVDAAGSPDSRQACMQHLRAGGTAVWIGNESPDSGIDAQVFVRLGQRIFGSAAYTRVDFIEAAGLVDDSLLDLVSHRPLSEGVEAMNELMSHDGGPVKVLLRP